MVDQYLISVLFLVLSIIGLRLVWYKKDKSEVWGASDIIPRVFLTLLLIFVIVLLGFMSYTNTFIGAAPSGR